MVLYSGGADSESLLHVSTSVLGAGNVLALTAADEAVSIVAYVEEPFRANACGRGIVYDGSGLELRLPLLDHSPPE